MFSMGMNSEWADGETAAMRKPLIGQDCLTQAPELAAAACVAGLDVRKKQAELSVLAAGFACTQLFYTAALRLVYQGVMASTMLRSTFRAGCTFPQPQVISCSQMASDTYRRALP